MRWRKKIEQRRSMRTKRPAVVKRKKRGIMEGSISSVVYGGDIC